MSLQFRFNRRQFLRHAGVLGAVSALGPQWQKAWAALSPTRLSYLSYRGTDFEGSWTPYEIEGNVPKDLDGTLYRIGPGRKVNYGVPLKHLFDGDACVTAIRFRNGQITAQSRFVETEERARERQSGKMLYHEFGTASPNGNNGFKRSPNIHIVPFGDRLMACSEAAAPIAIDPVDLKSLGAYNFHGTFPLSTTFTAHPKFDPVTGEAFLFGISQSLNPVLSVFKFNPTTGKLLTIGQYNTGGFPFLHDMMITENYIVFLIPPIAMDLWGAATNRAPVSELMNYEKGKPFRILIFPKDGRSLPIALKSSPGGSVFHNGNAYEENGKIIFDSILMDDMKSFDLFKSWAAEQIPGAAPSWITRFEIDLKSGQISRRRISDGQPTDFPTVDPRRLGRKAFELFALEAELGTSDPLALKTLVRWDLETLTPIRQKAADCEVFGEMVFAFGRQGSEQFLNLGYDSRRDQTFLDVRDPKSLSRKARIWMGRYLALGFHGSYVSRI